MPDVRVRPSPYRLVATDLDMTLCPPGGMIGERTRAAIRRVRESGAHFTIASGRTTAGLLHNLSLQRIDVEGMYVIGFNGAAVAQAWDGKLLASRRLEVDLTAEVIRRARLFPMEIMVPDGDLVHTERPDGRAARREAELNATTVIPVPDLAAAGLAPHVVLVSGEPETLATVAADLAGAFHGETEVILAAPRLLEVVAANVTKGAALAMLCDVLGIRPEATVAFGDHHNDIPLLRMAGLGIAVANAVPELKAAADRETASCADEGVADILDVLFPAYQ